MVRPAHWIVLLTGSRELYDERPIWAALDEQYTYALTQGLRLVVRHGACPRGADSHCAEWCANLGDLIDVDPHPADWNRLGKRAGFVRNTEMAELGADVCLAFPRGESSGTRHCMSEATRLRIEVLPR